MAATPLSIADAHYVFTYNQKRLKKKEQRNECSTTRMAHAENVVPTDVYKTCHLNTHDKHYFVTDVAVDRALKQRWRKSKLCIYTHTYIYTWYA